MRVVACGEQGSDEWKAARCGRITASRIVDVMNYLKRGGESADRANYRTELVSERLTGKSDDGAFPTKWLKEGKANESQARTDYELASDIFIESVGFVLHSVLDYSGASPDGLVGSDGCLEIKCPKSTTHVNWRMAGVAPEEHMPQMQWEMACCERLWCDFVSFDPRMPEDLQLFVVRVPRDSAMIAAIQAEVMKFEGEINAQIERLRK